MSAIALCTAPIDNATGIAAGYLDWRYVVRIAKAPTNKVLGTMILGTDVLTDLEWIDVTADAHGVVIERGATAGQRPGAGQVSFWLDNEAGLYDPYVSIYHGPGVLVQVLLGTAADTRPLITCLAVQWNEFDAASSQVRHVDIVGLETISILAEADDPAVAPVGAGESIGPRVSRILTAAAWQFGGAVSADLPHFDWGFQATTLAADAWATLLLTCDSLALQAVSAKNGTLSVTERDRGLLAVGLRTLGTDIPVVNDSIETANDDDRLLGTISVARVGGAAVTYTAAGIQGRFQRRSTQRFDLITQDPGGNADLARFAADALGQGHETYRVESVELDSGHGAKVWEFVSLMDIGTKVHISKVASPTTGVTFSNYLINGYALTISPMSEQGVQISATIRTAVQAASSWARYS